MLVAGCIFLVYFAVFCCLLILLSVVFDGRDNATGLSDQATISSDHFGLFTGISLYCIFFVLQAE